MRVDPRYFGCIVAGIIVEIMALVAAIILSHGGFSQPPAGLSFIFPFYALVPSEASDHGIVAVMLFFQMPVYGAIIARGWIIGRGRNYALKLLSVHCVAGIIGFFIQSQAAPRVGC